MKLKVDNRPLKPVRPWIDPDRDKTFFLLLSDQTCIVGQPFEIMKRWKRDFRDKAISDMFETSKRVNSGVTSLSKLIDYTNEDVYN